MLSAILGGENDEIISDLLEKRKRMEEFSETPMSAKKSKLELIPKDYYDSETTEYIRNKLLVAEDKKMEMWNRARMKIADGIVISDVKKTKRSVDDYIDYCIADPPACRAYNNRRKCRRVRIYRNGLCLTCWRLKMKYPDSTILTDKNGYILKL